MGVHPQNVGFILSNSSTDVNRRDHFSYSLTVGLKSTSPSRGDLSKNNDEDCKAKRDYTAWYNWDGDKIRAAGQNAIST